MFTNINLVTSAAVPLNGTVVGNYPAGTDAGHFALSGHKAFARGLQVDMVFGSQFTLAFGATQVTFTNKLNTPIPAGTVIALQLNRLGADGSVANASINSMPRVGLEAVARMQLGAPIAANAALLAASQAVGAGADAVLTTVGGVDLDVPRNVVAAWTGAAVLTVTGVDEYGKAMTEVSASGTALTGKKAFKRVTKLTFSAAVTAMTAGTGNVLGLPTVIDGAGAILAEIQDNGVAVAGTVVAADINPATGATGDVRGTYVPNAAPNGARKYNLIVAVDDPTARGVPQA